MHNSTIDIYIYFVLPYIYTYRIWFSLEVCIIYSSFCQQHIKGKVMDVITFVDYIHDLVELSEIALLGVKKILSIFKPPY